MTDMAAASAAPPTVCGTPCHYGGMSAARKYSTSDLGWMWHCNRRVKNAGDRCYQHKTTPTESRTS